LKYCSSPSSPKSTSTVNRPFSLPPRHPPPPLLSFPQKTHHGFPLPRTNEAWDDYFLLAPPSRRAFLFFIVKQRRIPKRAFSGFSASNLSPPLAAASLSGMESSFLPLHSFQFRDFFPICISMIFRWLFQVPLSFHLLHLPSRNASDFPPLCCGGEFNRPPSFAGSFPFYPSSPGLANCLFFFPAR